MNEDSIPSSENVTSGQPLERELRSLPPHQGAGITAGALAGAAALGAIGAILSPITLAAGVVGGAVAGALAGRGLAETRAPTDEAQYWREQHEHQPFAAAGPYRDFIDAYRIGYQEYSRRTPAGTFEQREEELRRRYEEERAPGSPDWDVARLAARLAFNRLALQQDSLIGYAVHDSEGASVGRVTTLWHQEYGAPQFIGVATAWVLGKTHVLPYEGMLVDQPTKKLTLPYSAEQVKQSPVVDPASPLYPETQHKARSHFGRTTQLPHPKS